ncbi:MAG: hypothetical protein LBF28_03310, partial [Rickettsiales bacterium]|nr:hypothetical protein [Rickettsiales bacterium]
MAGIKIPSSPNLEGTQPVLRQGSSAAMPNFFDDSTFKMINETKDAVSKEALTILKDQADSRLEDAMLQWQNHAQNAMHNLQTKYKGRDANDLYNRFLAKDLDKYTAKMLGGGGRDGMVVINDPYAQKEFKKRIAGYKSNYMTNLNAYEAREYDDYRTKTYEAANIKAAGYISNAVVEEDLDFGISEVHRITRSQNIGQDESYVRAVAAKKLDAAAAAYVENKITTDAVGAYERFANLKISSLLDSKNKTRIIDAIQKAYTDQQTQKAIAGDISEISDENIINIFGIKDKELIENKKYEILNKASAERGRVDKERAETFAVQKAELTGRVIDATNMQEQESAIKELANIDPESARQLTIDLSAQNNRIAGQKLINSLKGEPVYDASGNISIEAAADLLLSPDAAELVKQTIKANNDALDETPKVVELLAGISDGTVTADDPRVGDLTSKGRMTVLTAMRDASKYKAESIRMKQAGIDIEKDLEDAGIFAKKRGVVANPYQASLIKRNAVRQINEFKAKTGAYPDDALRRKMI